MFCYEAIFLIKCFRSNLPLVHGAVSVVLEYPTSQTQLYPPTVFSHARWAVALQVAAS